MTVIDPGYIRVFVELSQGTQGFCLTHRKDDKPASRPQRIRDFTEALAAAEELCSKFEATGAQVNLTISALEAGPPLQIQRQHKPSTVDVLDLTPNMGDEVFQVLALAAGRELASKEFPSLSLANWHAGKIAQELIDLGHQVILTKLAFPSIQSLDESLLRVELERRGYFVYRPESEPDVDPLRHQRIKSFEDREESNDERESERIPDEG